MKKTDKRRKGFTLIELIVVIAILAILAAIAVPNFIGLTKKANNATEVSAAAQYATAINVYNALVTVETDKIVAPTNAADVTAINNKLTTAKIPVNTDMTADILFSNVFARLQYLDGVFMVDPALKGDIPAATAAPSAG